MQSSIISQTPQNERSPRSERQYSQNMLHPKKQEWAIIYNQQALQNKQMAVLQKQFNKQRRQQFKSELEKQLNNKNQQQMLAKEEDKKFSDFIKNKIQEQQIREKNQKLQKMLEVRRVDRQNYQKMEAEKRAKALAKDMGASGLPITQKSQLQVKIERYNKRRQLTDALDKQLKLKEEQKHFERQNQYRVDDTNRQYMKQYYHKRDMVGPRRRQNEDIYHYFEKINEEKALKQRELQKKLVDDARLKKQYEQMRKQEEKNMKKKYAQSELKRTIEDQLKYKSQQDLKQKKFNPQQNTYQIIGNIFRDKRDNYDKKQYFQYLSRQAEEQSLRKRNLQYMNEHQYRLNMNQLNKAVNGNYEHRNYIDRSVNSIGAASRAKAASSMSLDLGRKQKIEDDQQFVQSRLDEIRRQGVPKNQNNNLSFHL